MIALLTGRVAYKAPTQLTLDVQGVGYEVFIPLSTYYGLPDLDETATLSIYTHLREDAIQLFGFLTQPEKEAFLLLTSVSGIGPKLGLSVLSGLSVADLVSAVQASDVDKIATVPGIGKKSAGRIVLELKDKLGRLHSGEGPAVGAQPESERGLLEDALSALVNLGYRTVEAKEALKQVERRHGGSRTLQDLIREALKDLAGG